MSRVRNADEFWLEYQKLLGDYRRNYKPLLDKLRNQFAAGGKPQVPPALDDALEFHTRTYIVNALLAALNGVSMSGLVSGSPTLLQKFPFCPRNAVQGGF